MEELINALIALLTGQATGNLLPTILRWLLPLLTQILYSMLQIPYPPQQSPPPKP